MAFLEFGNVRIAGLCAGVPKHKVSNLDIGSLSKDYDAASFVELTGIKERRVGNFTSSDLCLAAAEQLLNDLQWDKSSIEAIIFVSQYADYILPTTSCILQDKLGLSKECYAIDLPLGCSGFVYGLNTACSIISGGGYSPSITYVWRCKTAC